VLKVWYGYDDVLFSPLGSLGNSSHGVSRAASPHAVGGDSRVGIKENYRQWLIVTSPITSFINSR
jgi:hypothetical protein